MLLLLFRKYKQFNTRTHEKKTPPTGPSAKSLIKLFHFALLLSTDANRKKRLSTF